MFSTTKTDKNKIAAVAAVTPVAPVAPTTPATGLNIPRTFSDPLINPYDQLSWSLRTVDIKDESGNVVFQAEVNAPDTWSDMAVRVVASKYFYGDLSRGTNPSLGGRETSVKQLISRVSETISIWGEEDGYFASQQEASRFQDELSWLLLNQHGAFNSPVWFNVGLSNAYGIKGAANGWVWQEDRDRMTGELVGAGAVKCQDSYKRPQGSACFLQSVEDDMESIADLLKSEMILFKGGSGTGTDLSPLRSTKEKLSGGGKPSGPVSFMEVYDAAAGVIQSGGRTRRSAKMQILRCDHGDIVEFIECKTKEEAKARALIAAGYDSSFNGEAYKSIKFQNANLSVSATDEFMEAVKDGTGFDLVARTTGETLETINASDLLDKIAESTWRSGDPGMFFVDTINSWHTSPADGPITTANPCQPGFATVLTPEGIRTFDDIRVGSVIWSGRKWTTVIRKVATGIKAVNRYDTTVGSFVGTEDHRVVCKGKKVPVSEAEYIDRCCGPNVKNDTIDDQDAVDGWVFGDGSVHKASNNLVHFFLGRDDACFHDEYGSFLICHRPGLKDTAWEVKTTITAKELPKTFNRVVPDRFLKGNSTKIRGFLRGLYAANGSVCGGRVTLKAASLKVANAVRQMLSSIGIRAYMTCNKPSVVRFANGPYECKESYDLNITIDRDKFVDLIGFVHPHKFDRIQPHLAKIAGNARKTSYEIQEVVYLGDYPVYDITVDADEHTYWTDGLLVSNCGEFVYVDNSACNLASLNLMKFRKSDGSFDTDRFQAACRIFIIAQDIIVSRASYPTKKICENSHKLRPLGLGYCGLGALLMASGLPYDSDEGRSLAGAITALMTGRAYLTSAEIAKVKGPFAGFEANRDSMMRVIKKHLNSTHHAMSSSGQHAESGELVDLWTTAHSLWIEAIVVGSQVGFRNGQVTLCAPTGTIAFLMDSGHSTGLEPSIALVQYKTLAGGGMLKIVNPVVELALNTLGYGPLIREKILAYIEKYDTIEEIEGGELISWIKPEHLPIFDCAFPPKNGVRSIAWQGHIKMLAAIQPFLSGSSSKTVNMPADATIADIRSAYILAWELGVKDVAIYRDGSKESQPVSTSKASDAKTSNVKSDNSGEKPLPYIDFDAASKNFVDAVWDALGNEIRPEESVLTAIERLIKERDIYRESARPRRERLPETRQSTTHKMILGGAEAYLTVGHYPDGRPGELFVTMAKEGSTLGGLMDAWATGVSIMLQYGIPLDVLVAKFSGGRFEPMGMTRNRDIPIASSLIDYVVRWMDRQYGVGRPKVEVVQDTIKAIPAEPTVIAALPPMSFTHGPLCPDCGGMTVPTGRCWACSQCGTSVGGCG